MLIHVQVNDFLKVAVIIAINGKYLSMKLKTAMVKQKFLLMIVEVEEKERYQLYRITSHLIQIVVVATKHCMILMMFQSYSW